MNKKDINSAFDAAYRSVMNEIFNKVDYGSWVTDGYIAMDPEIPAMLKRQRGPSLKLKFKDVPTKAKTQALKGLLEESLYHNWDWGLKPGIYLPAYARLIVWLMGQGYLVRPGSRTRQGNDYYYQHGVYTPDLRPVLFLTARLGFRDEEGNLHTEGAAYFDGKQWTWPEGESPEDEKNKRAVQAQKRKEQAENAKERKKIAAADAMACLNQMFPEKAVQQAFLDLFKEIKVYNHSTAKMIKVAGDIPIKYFLQLVCAGKVQGFSSNTPEGEAAREIARRLFAAPPYETSKRRIKEYPSDSGAPIHSLFDPIRPKTVKESEAMWVKEFTLEEFHKMPWIPLSLLGRDAEANHLIAEDKKQGAAQVKT